MKNRNIKQYLRGVSKQRDEEAALRINHRNRLVALVLTLVSLTPVFARYHSDTIYKMSVIYKPYQLEVKREENKIGKD